MPVSSDPAAPPLSLPASPGPAAFRSRRLQRRHAVAILSFTAVVALFLSWGFPSDRGWQFERAHAKTDRTGVYDLAKARMLARVVGHIRAHYVAPERVDPRRMVAAAMWRVQAEVPEVRVAVHGKGGTLVADSQPKPGGGPFADALDVTVGEVTRNFPLDQVDDLYQLNWKLADVFEFLERHLPPQVDLENLEYAAVNGLLSTLDPHTVLMSPRVYRELQLSQKGRFGGLGITVGEVDGYLVIQQVMRDTPAAEAGLEVDDRIVQIGGASTISMGLDEAVNLLRGEPGSECVLWLARDGWKEPKPFKLVRREIQLPSVEEASLGDGIGWVYVRGFQETTDTDLAAALTRLDKQPGGLKGLVLDLRDDPGGLLDKAIAVADTFLSKGTVVTTVREGGKERDESHAIEAGTRADLPLVVLVNRGSASASEIVAGALKRNDRALVLGQTSFGKGSVQVVYKIDDAALKLTVAQYLTPGDVSIQGVGIVPDIDLVNLRVPQPIAGAPFDGRMDLRPAPEDAGGEASLASHLSSEKTRPERPAMTLRLLEDQRTPMHRQKRGDARIPDATVRLAKEVLQVAPAADRKQALVQLQGFLAARQASEDTQLAAALAPWGIDWKAGPRPSPRALEVKLSMPAEVTAGLPFEATVTVKNLGKKPVARVHAELESGIPALAGREVAFGWIEPGKSIERAFTMSLPASLGRAGDVVTARLYADGEALPEAGTGPIAIAPVPPPVFAHTVAIDDIPGPIGPTGPLAVGPSKATAAKAGNGDGLLQRRERVAVDVWITNIGAGPARSVLATLRNESGPDVFIHLGRQELGALAPGETKRATFELEVREGLKARLVELGLEVADTAGSFFTPGPVPVELAVFPDELPPREATKGFAVLPSVATRLHAGASRDAPEVAEAAAGAVLEVTGKVGDWLEVAWLDHPGAQADRRRGFVPAERVRFADQGGAAKESVRALAQHRPPVLELGATPAFVDDGDLALTGIARFASAGGQRRLAYVFRGRDKVFFRSAEPSPEPGQDVRLPFETTIALLPGRNEITVIAREGDDGVARTSFVVYRR